MEGAYIVLETENREPGIGKQELVPCSLFW